MCCYLLPQCYVPSLLYVNIAHNKVNTKKESYCHGPENLNLYIVPSEWLNNENSTEQTNIREENRKQASTNVIKKLFADAVLIQITFVNIGQGPHCTQTYAKSQIDSKRIQLLFNSIKLGEKVGKILILEWNDSKIYK